MSKSPSKNRPVISVRGARVHNLKDIDVDIPKEELVVITGLSGSGKSSLAFDTIYAEGQRRYMESLSSYARQFLELQDKPDVDEIAGLSPTIAIDQKSSSHNPRSTVGTVTEVYDFLRVLFARAGRPHDPETGEPLAEQSPSDIRDEVLGLARGAEVLVFGPVIREQKGVHRQVLVTAAEAGIEEVRMDGFLMDVSEAISMRRDKNKPHSIDLLLARFGPEDLPTPEHLKNVIEKALDYGDGTLLVVRDEDGEESWLSEGFGGGNAQIPSLEPRLFSFNSPYGACPECMGLGEKLVMEPRLVIPNDRLTIAEGAIRPWSRIAGNQTSHLRLIEAVGRKKKFTLNTAVGKLSKEKLGVLLDGTGDEEYQVGGEAMRFPGVLAMLEEKYKETSSDYVRQELEGYMRKLLCPACEGKRLSPVVLAVTIADRSISDLTRMPISDLLEFFLGIAEVKTRKTAAGKAVATEVKIRPEIAGGLSETEILVIQRTAKEIVGRLQNLIDVGLGYLTLDRSAMTLSGGESQRVRLSTQLGSTLSGVIYILDEPSIGLHPRDNDKLIGTIKRLRDLGNTVVVVEHDEAMVRAADYVFDVGPGAGEYGGEIVAEGTPEQIAKDKDSLTGQYLSGKKVIPAPKKARKGNGKKLTIVGASEHNLKDIDVDIPLGKLVCVTGVSGSGKSTLILDILGKALSKHFYRAKAFPGAHKEIKGLRNIDKVVAVDQSPIGRTPRSNPATYTGVFTAIRDLFASQPEAKMRKLDAGTFSFNVKDGGRCEACVGEGLKRIEMQFLPDVYVVCPNCGGKRYSAETLEIHYKNKTISDVLEMTVEEARRFFADQPAIFDRLNLLHEVGLGYVKLGQSATTLSGGEAQRVKLATELSRRATGKTLYILDEPTTGLHFEDIKRLLSVLHMLADKGNTVLIIEHNLDVVKGADWVIDIGPDGGQKGGEVVAEGTPKEIARNKSSLTGSFLKKVL